MHPWPNDEAWYSQWSQSDNAGTSQCNGSSSTSMPESMSYRRQLVDLNDPSRPRSSPVAPLWNESSPLTELSSPSPAPPQLDSERVKLEPSSPSSSPRFIIEPLLPSSSVHKPSSLQPSYHGRRSHSPESQSELVERFMQSQQLAPPSAVPLRATHATPEARRMMNSFRLNPFALHSKPKSDVYVTWDGTEPKPLDEEPKFFEWQLDGYSVDGVEDEVELLVMDSMDSSSETSGDGPSDVFATVMEERKPLFCSSSQASLSSPELQYPPLPNDEKSGDGFHNSFVGVHAINDERPSGSIEGVDRFSAYASDRNRFRLHSTPSSISSNQSLAEFSCPSPSSHCSSPQGVPSAGLTFSSNSTCRPTSSVPLNPDASSPYACNAERVQNHLSGYSGPGSPPKDPRYRYPITSMLNKGGHGRIADSASCSMTTHLRQHAVAANEYQVQRRDSTFSNTGTSYPSPHQNANHQVHRVVSDHYASPIGLPCLPPSLSVATSSQALPSTYSSESSVPANRQINHSHPTNEWTPPQRWAHNERSPLRNSPFVDSRYGPRQAYSVAPGPERGGYTTHTSHSSTPRGLTGSRSTPSLPGRCRQDSESVFPDPDHTSYALRRPSMPSSYSSVGSGSDPQYVVSSQSARDPIGSASSMPQRSLSYNRPRIGHFQDKYSGIFPRLVQDSIIE